MSATNLGKCQEIFQVYFPSLQCPWVDSKVLFHLGAKQGCFKRKPLKPSAPHNRKRESADMLTTSSLRKNERHELVGAQSCGSLPRANGKQGLRDFLQVFCNNYTTNSHKKTILQGALLQYSWPRWSCHTRADIRMKWCLTRAKAV